MNSTFKILCIALLAATSGSAFAQDMSGWSDKTVCRLINVSGNQEYIDEAASRRLECNIGSISETNDTVGSSPENPLDSLSIPADWALISNQDVFDKERMAHIDEAFYDPSEFEGECSEFLKDWITNVQKDNGGQLLSCAQDLNIFGYVGFNPNEKYVPAIISDLFLHWAQTNALKSPKNKFSKNFTAHVYDSNTSLGSFAAYYAVFYDHFNYTLSERATVDRMFVSNLLSVKPKDLLQSGAQQCDHRSLPSAARGLTSGKMESNSCGSILWSQMQGQLTLGLRLGNEDLFKKGIENVKWNLQFIDKDGIFIPYAAGKNGHAIDYMDTVPHYLGVLTELFATVGYDFLQHRIPSGITIKEALDGLVKVYSNHKVLLKYNGNERGKYGGFGWTISQFKSWTPDEALSMASYSWTLFARQVPRYVDLYRPDLQKYRTLDFIATGENGQGIDNITGHTAIDPYMLYEANYLAEIGVDLSYEHSYKVAPYYVYQAPGEPGESYDLIKTTKAISKGNQPPYMLEGLASWLKRIEWKGSLEEAISLDHAPTRDDLGDGEYALSYWIISAFDGGLEPRPVDKLIVSGGNITYMANSSYQLPTKAQRKSMEFEFDKGIVTASGPLQFWSEQPLEETMFRGVLGTNLLLGTLLDGDIVALLMTKL